MRLKAMESLAESKAQKRPSLSDDNEFPKNSKKRRSSDTLQYLREKAKNDRELKRQELELLRQEIAMRQAEFQQT